MPFGAPPKTTFTTKDSSSIWIQPYGPGTQPVFLGLCDSLGDLVDDRGSVNELIQYFNGVGGWSNPSGVTLSAPSQQEVTITTPTTKELHELDRYISIRQNQCNFPFFSLKRCGGRVDNFTRWEVAFVGVVLNLNNRTFQNVANGKEDLEGMSVYSLSFAPRVYKLHQFVVVSKSVTETQALNDIAANLFNVCPTCDGSYEAGDFVVAGADSAAGPATANVHFSSNALSTFPAVTDPFAADEHISSVLLLEYGADLRIIAARGVTDAGNPAEVAISDDRGVTWTLVNVGSTNAQYVLSHQGLCLAGNNLFCVTTGGYIYKSTDYGASWSTVDAGVTTTNNLTGITFFDDRLGWAFGVTNTLLVTYNAGATWSTASGPSAQAAVTINTAAATTRQILLLGYADGDLYFTKDGATVWESISHTGAGVGQVRALDFLDALQGVMVRNNAGPVGTVLRTIDGGRNWIALTTPDNDGLNSVIYIHENKALAVGEPINAGNAALFEIYVP